MEATLSSQINQLCYMCGSKECFNCKISIQETGQVVTVNGYTKEIEKIETVPHYL